MCPIFLNVTNCPTVKKALPADLTSEGDNQTTTNVMLAHINLDREGTNWL